LTGRRIAPVRWGILGAANIALKKVIPGMQGSALAEVVAIASRDIAKARAAADRLGISRAYGSYQELIEDPDIEAIYNPLPNHLHVPWSIRAAEQGKHVLCEKPIALTAREARDLLAARDKTGVQIGEAFMVRTHPQWLKVREIVASGRIGELRLITGHFSYYRRDRGDIRSRVEWGGGALMDVGCYPVNFCRAVYGHPPVAVAARVYVPEGGEVECSANAVLEFGNGRFGLIDSSFELPERQVSKIIGEAGTITIPVPFTPGHREAEVILALEGQTIHQRVSVVDQAPNRSSRSSTAGILSSATLAKASRTKRSWPEPNMSPGMVSRFSSSARRLDTVVERWPEKGCST